MEHKYKVLSHLQENEITTQRKISRRTGLSLNKLGDAVRETGGTSLSFVPVI